MRQLHAALTAVSFPLPPGPESRTLPTPLSAPRLQQTGALLCPRGSPLSRAHSEEFQLTEGSGEAEEHRRAASPRQRAPRETNCSRAHCCQSRGQTGPGCWLNPPVRKEKHHPSEDQCQGTKSVLKGHFPMAGGTSLHRHIAEPQISPLCSPETSHQIERRVLGVHQVPLGLLAFHRAYNLLHLEIKLWPPKGKKTSTLNCLAKILKEGII